MPQSPKMAGSPAAVPAMPGAPQPTQVRPAIPQQPTRLLQLPAHIGPLKIDPEMLSADEPMSLGEIPSPQKVDLPPALLEKLPPFDDLSFDNPSADDPWWPPRPAPAPQHAPRPLPYPWETRDRYVVSMMRRICKSPWSYCWTMF